MPYLINAVTKLTEQEYRIFAKLAKNNKVSFSDYLRAIVIDAIHDEGFELAAQPLPSEDSIIAKYAEGLKPVQIARALQVNHHHVYYVLRKHNAKRRREVIADARRFRPENCQAIAETSPAEGANPS